jgi:hypothetical protein
MATTNALTNYGENQVITWLLNTSGNKYVALFTTPVAEDGTGSEATGTWYSRQLAAFTITADSGENTDVLDFGEVSDAPITISHWAIYDAATAGNLWVYGAFETTKTASVGTNILIQPGDVVITAQ